MKFTEGSEMRLRGGRLVSLARYDTSGLEAVLQRYPGLIMERLFTRSESALDQENRRIEGKMRRELPDKNLIFRFILRDPATAEGVLDALNSLDIVEFAFAESLPQPLPGALSQLTSTPSFEGSQGYIGPAPSGTDAVFAWTQPGGQGTLSRIIDVEYSWNQHHEDLTRSLGGLIANGTPVDPCLPDPDAKCPGGCGPGESRQLCHGTAVLGELIADRNGFGVTGSVFRAGIGMVNVLNEEFGYRLAEAIDLAHSRLQAGDVILIEQQVEGRDSCIGCYVPAEWDSGAYIAILTATADGIIVVEAAGNGNQNLDESFYFGSPFPRGLPDSGAIIVGAGAAPGCSNPPRGRLGFSTYGSRVNVQGWGECIVTSGYGDLYSGGSIHTDYTSMFGGTSGASAIVAAAAAQLSSVFEYRGLFITPVQIRQALQLKGTQQDLTPGALPGNIGPLPNVRSVLESPLTPFAAWAQEGESVGAEFGSSVAAGDVNGDGYGDLIVGAEYYNSGEVGEGKVFLYLGSRSGLSATPSWTAESNHQYGAMGRAVAAGDFNADGYSDVLAAAPGYHQPGSTFIAGAVFAWYGGPGGLGDDGTPQNAAWAAYSESTSGSFGAAVASAGDLNGDGAEEVVIGDPVRNNEGFVYLWYGSNSGLGPPATSSAAHWTARGVVAGRFGSSVAPAGDVNSDGYGDLVVGAEVPGRVHVWHGSAAGLAQNGIPPNADWMAEVDQAGSGLGVSVASGDINTDGISDIVAGAYRYDVGNDFNQGLVAAWLGVPGGRGLPGSISNADWVIRGDQSQLQLGFSLALGDFNGDRCDDAIVGAPTLLSSGQTRAYISDCAVLGSTDVWRLSGDQRFGASLAAGMDVNGDGYSEASVGSRYFDGGMENEGVAYLYYGMPLTSDRDGDGVAISQGDCRDDDSSLWGIPGEVQGLMMAEGGGVLTWNAPDSPGGTVPEFDTLRSNDPASFTGAGTVCIESDGLDRLASDDETPTSGQSFYYLVRAQTLCGVGTLGEGSDGATRLGRPCP